MDTVWSIYEDGGWHIKTFSTKKKAEAFLKKYEKLSDEIWNKYYDPKIDDIKNVKEYEKSVLLLNQTYNIHPDMGQNHMVMADLCAVEETVVE